MGGKPQHSLFSLKYVSLFMNFLRNKGCTCPITTFFDPKTTCSWPTVASALHHARNLLAVATRGSTWRQKSTQSRRILQITKPKPIVAKKIVSHKSRDYHLLNYHVQLAAYFLRPRNQQYMAQIVDGPVGHET